MQPDFPSLKKKLFTHCIGYIQQRISNAQEAIETAQAAANEETKSSAGDKYETGRSMMQLEMEKNSIQLEQSVKLKNILDQIKIDRKFDSAHLGSLVITDQSNFFIAISVGQIVLDGRTFLIISQDSPIGAKLKGLKAGDSFIFNNKRYKIDQVW
jgi:transcription elongation GreA/GreB family factor